MADGCRAVDGTDRGARAAAPPGDDVARALRRGDERGAASRAWSGRWPTAGDGLTQVDLVHGDLARSPLTWAHVRTGWVWILDGLKTLLETGDDAAGAATGSRSADVVDDAAGDWHRAQGVECNNSIWELVGEPASPERDEELLRRAYASAYHWQRAAGREPGERDPRSCYMLAKVHLLTGQPERSLHYADAAWRCARSTASPTSTSPTRTRPAPGRCRRWAATTRPRRPGRRPRATPVADPEDRDDRRGRPRRRPLTCGAEDQVGGHR